MTKNELKDEVRRLKRNLKAKEREVSDLVGLMDDTGVLRPTDIAPLLANDECPDPAVTCREGFIDAATCIAKNMSKLTAKSIAYGNYIDINVAFFADCRIARFEVVDIALSNENKLTKITLLAKNCLTDDSDGYTTVYPQTDILDHINATNLAILKRKKDWGSNENFFITLPSADNTFDSTLWRSVKEYTRSYDDTEIGVPFINKYSATHFQGIAQRPSLLKGYLLNKPVAWWTSSVFKLSSLGIAVDSNGAPMCIDRSTELGFRPCIVITTSAYSL